MSIMVRPESGTKARTANQRDVNKHINDLQQELTRSRAETQRVRDKLNCLISLVRRSWNGDRNASIHLANIIGLDLPPFLLDSGSTARPGTRMQTPSASTAMRAVTNWERLTIKLLQRDYDQLQSEIREYQQRYIENRSRFMDEVMHYHKQDMSHVSLSRPSSAKLNTLDQQFITFNSVVKNDGKNESRQPLYRSKSAVSRPQRKVQREVVEQAEVKLRDLFVDSSSSTAHPSGIPAADASLRGARARESPRRKRVQPDYDDSKRYIHGNLFNVDDMLTRKPRPMSAAVLQERDRQRARPRSAGTLNFNSTAPIANGERPLKYETTRPVSGKRPSSGKAKKHLAPADGAPQADINGSASAYLTEVSEDGADSPTNHVPPIIEELDEMVDPTPEQPPISVRVKNAITRPESVDKFTSDLKDMEHMEKMFKMNTLALQKKLGLHENGMI